MERQGIAGHGEGGGEAKITGAKTGTFNFSQILGDDRYVFSAGSEGTELLELVAGSRKLTIAPVSARESEAEGFIPLISGTAPHLWIDVGDASQEVLDIAQCAQGLAVAIKGKFCVHVNILQLQQGCPVSSWRMSENNDAQIDWIDGNHITSDGTFTQFTVFSQHGTTNEVHKPFDREADFRVVRADCSSGGYRLPLSLIATRDGGETISLNAAPSAADDLIQQDVGIACSGKWRSEPVADPIGETAYRFDQARTRINDRKIFKRF